MCSAGNRVKHNCTELSSTTCIPCVDETYTDQPNGLDKCRPCSICDAGLGLESLRRCMSSSNTVCTCMKGHYCEESNQEGCKLCQKHSTCNPGQFIKQSGKMHIMFMFTSTFRPQNSALYSLVIQKLCMSKDIDAQEGTCFLRTHFFM
ncbi:TNR14 factor, partial [Amia calva]|nr:TNR14 factor [Amia calva]